jgi:hypothetical protein
MEWTSSPICNGRLSSLNGKSILPQARLLLALILLYESRRVHKQVRQGLWLFLLSYTARHFSRSACKLIHSLHSHETKQNRSFWSWSRHLHWSDRYWLVSSGSDSSLHGNSATTGRSLIHSYRQVTHEKLALAVHRNIAYDTPAIVSEWDIWQRPKQAWKTSW